MKLIKTAGKSQVKMSRKEWESIGEKAGWIKVAKKHSDKEIMSWKRKILDDPFAFKDCSVGLQKHPEIQKCIKNRSVASGKNEFNEDN